MLTRHLVAESEEIWTYEVHLAGSVVGRDFVAKDGLNEPYPDAIDETGAIT